MCACRVRIAACNPRARLQVGIGPGCLSLPYAFTKVRGEHTHTHTLSLSLSLWSLCAILTLLVWCRSGGRGGRGRDSILGCARPPARPHAFALCPIQAGFALAPMVLMLMTLMVYRNMYFGSQPFWIYISPGFLGYVPRAPRRSMSFCVLCAASVLRAAGGVQLIFGTRSIGIAGECEFYVGNGKQSHLQPLADANGCRG